jgi:hypothetical protein
MVPVGDRQQVLAFLYDKEAQPIRKIRTNLHFFILHNNSFRFSVTHHFSGSREI